MDRNTTEIINKALGILGELKLRPGLNLPKVGADTEIIRYWRKTGNGKGLLFLVPESKCQSKNRGVNDVKS